MINDRSLVSKINLTFNTAPRQHHHKIMEEYKYDEVLLEVLGKDTQDQEVKKSINGAAKEELDISATVGGRQKDVGKIMKEFEENSKLQSKMNNSEVEVIYEVKGEYKHATENESSSDDEEEDGHDVVNVNRNFVKPQFMKVKNPPSPIRKAPPMPRHMLFEEEYIRKQEVTAKKFQKKLKMERRILERQKRKAAIIDVNKKYLGFGQVFDPVKAKLQKKAEKKLERDARRLRLLKIANGNKEEKGLIYELLNDAESDANSGSFKSPPSEVEIAASSKSNFCYLLEDSGIASSSSNTSFSLDASYMYTSPKPIKQEISNMNTTIENNNAVEFSKSGNTNLSNSGDLQDWLMM